jgi:hypothetical protein
MLELVSAELASHIAQALTAMDRRSSPRPEQAFAMEDLEKVCCKLISLMEASDAEAQVCAEDNAQMLRSAFGSGYGELLTQVQHFEFKEALISLQKLMQVAGVALG